MTRWLAATTFAAALALPCSPQAPSTGGPRATPPQLFSIRTIGPLPGHRSSEANGIDDATRVVGWSDARTAYSWTASGIRALPDHGGGLQSRGAGVGPGGQPLGSARSGGLDHATIWTARPDGGFSLIDLGTAPGDIQSIAEAMNHNGVVVGCSDNALGFVPAVYELVRGRYVGSRLPVIPGDLEGVALDIDGNDAAVGYTASPVIAHAVRWTRTDGGWSAQDLGGLAAFASAEAVGIDRRGNVAGSAFQPRTGRWHFAVWTAAGILDLGAPPGRDAIARGVSPDGAIVGYGVNTSDRRALLCPRTRLDAPLIDLHAVSPPGTAWSSLYEARDMNAKGEIVGVGVIRGFFQSFLLTPIRVRLTGPDPGVAGVANRLTVSGATPGGVVHFFVAATGGETVIPGCVQSLDLASPIALGSAVANPSGQASLSTLLPAITTGTTLHFQAFDAAACEVSDVRVHGF